MRSKEGHQTATRLRGIRITIALSTLGTLVYDLLDREGNGHLDITPRNDKLPFNF